MPKKNLLLYAHYYYPDVASTGQILQELAEGMLEDFNITVICVVPSYSGVIPDKYKKRKYYFEDINGVKIIRVRVPEFKKEDKLSRIKNILTYFIRSIIATLKSGPQHYVFSISQPPIFGGLLGVIGKWIKRAKYIYNIQDFNPEQIIAVGYSKNRFVINLMLALDKFSCRQADKVIVVGRDMVETLKNRFKGHKVPSHCYINNWIDEKAIYPLEPTHEKVVEFKEKYGLTNKFVFMYSGNLGLYYDLENLIKVIGKFNNQKDVVFAFVGDGSIKSQLEAYKQEHELDNVIFIPYQDKKDLIYSLNAADVHWVVNANGIKGVSVPSKIYGVMAAGKPVLGVLEDESEAQNIVEKAGCGFVVSPKEYIKMSQLIDSYIQFQSCDNLETMGKRGHEYLLKNLTKELSIQKYKMNLNHSKGEC